MMIIMITVILLVTITNHSNGAARRRVDVAVILAGLGILELGISSSGLRESRNFVGFRA